MDVLSAVGLIRAFYLLSAIAVLVARLSTPLRDRFLEYGARDSQKIQHSHVQGAQRNNQILGQSLNYLATFKVPHYWFRHFYFLSLSCSTFWLWQICTHGAVFCGIAQYVTPTAFTIGDNFALSKAVFCLTMMMVQGFRRLYECLFVTKPSSSTMWIGHYVIGMAFYLVTNMAIWIEQAPEIMQALQSKSRYPSGLWKLDYIQIPALTAFLTASKLQHDYHVYLSSLPKYTLPDSGAFRSIIAPHYTAECAIYLSLAVMSAKQGTWLNWTLITALVFVMVNLGITADGTKKWMSIKFNNRRNEIEKRWRMIPGVW